jgi:hypothetical protein
MPLECNIQMGETEISRAVCYSSSTSPEQALEQPGRARTARFVLQVFIVGQR